MNWHTPGLETLSPTLPGPIFGLTRALPFMFNAEFSKMSMESIERKWRRLLDARIWRQRSDQHQKWILFCIQIWKVRILISNLEKSHMKKVHCFSNNWN